MNIELPRISVLLLCWNHETFLEQCIRALSKQTDKRFETVFLDNRSNDDSLNLATHLFASYSVPVTILSNEKSAGVSKNFNTLLKASKGDLICPLSTDDWYCPRFIEMVRSTAAKDTTSVWFYGERASFTEEHGELVEFCDYADGDVWPRFLQGKFPVNLNGAAYRRDALEAVGGWDEELALEDIDLVFRLAEKGKCRRIPEPLAVYRSHPSGASKNNDFIVQGVREFYRKHAKHFPRDGKRAESDAIRQIAARAIDIEDFNESFRLLLMAYRCDPLNPETYRTAGYLLRRVAKMSIKSLTK